MRDAVQKFSEDSPFEPDAWSRFAPNLHYISGDIGDPALYTGIKDELDRVGRANVLFYLATQPSYYGEIIDYLGAAGLGRTTGDTWRRVVIEKPFGHDLESARALNERIHKVFDEDEIYRIDHY